MSDPAPTARRPNPLLDLGVGAAWLVGIAAGLAALDFLLGRMALGAVILGAVIVDLAVTRAGVKWDAGGPSSLRDAARGVARGAGVALLAAAVVIAASRALSWVSIEGPALPSLSLLLAVLRCAALGVRDELLYRGLPLTVAERAGVPRLAARGFAALAGAAAIALVPGASPGAAALAFGVGWLSATFWQHERAAYASVGLHATWALLVGSVLRGGLLDVTFRSGTLAVGPRASGAPAWLAAAVLVLTSVILERTLQKRAPVAIEKER